LIVLLSGGTGGAKLARGLLDVLGKLQDRLVEYKRALMTSDWAAVDALLDQAKRTRDALGS